MKKFTLATSNERFKISYLTNIFTNLYLICLKMNGLEERNNVVEDLKIKI